LAANIVSKSEFKAKALEFFRQIETTGRSFIVIDHGRLVLEVRPYHSGDIPTSKQFGNKRKLSKLCAEHPSAPLASQHQKNAGFYTLAFPPKELDVPPAKT
jgi:hypothetical protein